MMKSSILMGAVKKWVKVMFTHNFTVPTKEHWFIIIGMVIAQIFLKLKKILVLVMKGKENLLNKDVILDRHDTDYFIFYILFEYFYLNFHFLFFFIKIHLMLILKS